MKTQNILADEMQTRPELFKANRLFAFGVPKANRRNVIGQRIKPYIHRVRRIIRHGNPPANGRLQTTNREILKTSADEALDLVISHIRLHKIRARFVQLKQGFIVIRKSEEIALL